MRDGDFEWDDAKAAANLLRHGISFTLARDVFLDPHGITTPDDSMDYGEDRHLTIGEINSRLIAVVWTLRGDRTRIISARPAAPKERRAYHV
ncbi:MAG: BrnT family toxin [Caulobacter sp.]|nr:BrnT family toxin [Caulobacter sp.]